MRAILIDPYVQMCTEIDLPQNAYVETRQIIGCDTAGTFYPRLQPGRRLICWCDDNGLLHDEVPPLWTIDGYNQPIPGRGILRGLTDGDGDHCEPYMSLDELRAMITWRTDLVFAGTITTESVQTHPQLGPMTHIRTEAHFLKKADVEAMGFTGSFVEEALKKGDVQ